MVNKAALTRAINKSAGISLREAALCVDVVIQTINDGLLNGRRIELRGLGSFAIKKAAVKKLSFANIPAGRIPAHCKIVFRPCQKLRETVRNISVKPVRGLERETIDG